MRAGDKVRRRSDGQLAEVLAQDDHELHVRTPDGMAHTWGVKSVTLVMGTRLPRGVATASDRAVAAYRQHLEEGKSAKELGLFYKVPLSTVQGWFRAASERLEEQRHLKAALAVPPPKPLWRRALDVREAEQATRSRRTA